MANMATAYCPIAGTSAVERQLPEHVETEAEVMDAEEEVEEERSPGVTGETVFGHAARGGVSLSSVEAAHGGEKDGVTETDDLSIMIKRAGEIGISRKLYETFLMATYGQDLDELTGRAEVVVEQKAMFAAAKSPSAMEALKCTIIAAANKYLKTRGSPGVTGETA